MTDLVTLVTLVTNCLSDDDSPEARSAINEEMITLGIFADARRDIFRAADLRRRMWRRSRNLSACAALALVTAPDDRYAQAPCCILRRRDDRPGVMVPAGVAHRLA
jgi:hypothetical protein